MDEFARTKQRLVEIRERVIWLTAYADRLQNENAHLQRRLVAHHSMHNLSDEALHDAYTGDEFGKCPICKETT